MNKFSLRRLLEEKVFLFEKYHNATKLRTILLNERNSKDWPEAWKTVYFKSYPRLEGVALPKPNLPVVISLKESLLKRKSIRKFSKSCMSFPTLSTLLFYSAGLRNKNPQWKSNRFYPSGGARYPLEVYVISVNSDLPRGIYHYYVKNHCLEKLLMINKLDFQNAFTTNNQTWIKNVSIIIIITAIFRRSSVKYGERAYRLVLLEAGHLGQNFYLVSSALNLGCCAIAGVNDIYLEKLLDIDGRNESVVYTLGIGNKK